MKPELLEERFKEIFDEVMAYRNSGQREYAQATNAFSNFERLSAELDTTPQRVLWTYAMKHKDGIASHLRGNTSQREPVQGRIKDLIVYLFILHAMEDYYSDKSNSK